MGVEPKLIEPASEANSAIEYEARKPLMLREGKNVTEKHQDV